MRLDDLMRQEEHRRELADLKASDDEDSGGVSMNQQIIRMVREQLAAQMGEEDGERDITLSMDPAALGRAGDDDADAAMEVRGGEGWGGAVFRGGVLGVRNERE